MDGRVDHTGSARAMPEERRARIVALLARRQRVSVNALADELAASRETIRRDLAELEERGLLRKVHGGAVIAQTAIENAFSTRLRAQSEEKLRIAARAATLFAPGDSLMIDAGSTTAVFAAALARRRGLTVITNAIAVAERLRRGPGDAHVHLLGGRFEGEVGETLGPVTLQQIATFRVDHAVLTIGAVDADGGFMDYSLDEATVAQAMMAQARATTVLCDHTKLARTALVRLCDLGAVARLVTDAPPPPRLAAALADAGVEVVVA